jgi:hypothetical protein
MRLAAAAAVAAAAVASAASAARPYVRGGANDPASVARRAIGQLAEQPFSADLWAWGYGPGIEISSAYEISKAMGQVSGVETAGQRRTHDAARRNEKRGHATTREGCPRSRVALCARFRG